MTIYTNREFFKYAGPIALSSVGGLVVGFTDTLIIGRYSTESLAGVGLGASIYELPLNALLGSLMAYRIIAPKVSGIDPQARDTIGLRSVLKGIYLWVICGFIILFAIGNILFFNSNKILQESGKYLIGRSLGIIPEILITAVSITLVSWGRAKIPLFTFLITSSVNLIFDFALIYGLGPFPEIGSLGAGTASTLGLLAVVPVIFIVFFLEIQNVRNYIPSNIISDYFSGWEKLTLPAVASAVLDYAGNIVFTFVIFIGGAQGLAATRIANNTHLLVFVLISSISSSALYIIGRHSIDITNSEEARSDLKHKFISIGIVVGIILSAFSWPISFTASSDPSVQLLSTLLIIIISATCPIISWAYLNVTLLRSMEKTGSEFMSNAAAVWVAQIPIAILGALLFQTPGAFIGLIAYWVFRGIYSSYQVAKYISTEKGSRHV